MSRIVLVVSLCLLFALPLGAQEEEGGGDHMGLLGLSANFLSYTYTNVEDVPDDGVDTVNFGPNLSAALLTGGFAIAPDFYILVRFGFNMHWEDGDWQDSTFQIGPGIRYDFLADPVVAYGGIFLSYALQEVGTGGGGELSLHYLIPELFVGAEVPLHDQFSLGGQFALSYMHCWMENKNVTPAGTVTNEAGMNGVTLALLFSATVYF